MKDDRVPPAPLAIMGFELGNVLICQTPLFECLGAACNEAESS